MKSLLVLFTCLATSTCFSHERSEEYTSLDHVLPFDGFGWFGKSNKENIAKLIKKHNVHTVVELGSFLGLSTRFIAKLLPQDGIVYAVDHWLGSKEHQNPSKKKVYHKLPTLYEQFLSNIIHAGLCDKVIPLKMSTLEAVHAISLRPNMVYVDASHDFDSVLKDLEAWFPLIQGHGVMCGDDWDWGKDVPVRRAVIHFARQHNLKYASYGNFWVLIE